MSGSTLLYPIRAFIMKRFNEGDIIYNGMKIKTIKRSYNSSIVYTLVCDCGRSFICKINRILSFSVASCNSCSNTKYGQLSSRNIVIYRTWLSIKQRCLNANCKSYRFYGGRGITMFPLWVTDYNCFDSWIQNNLGPRPQGYSLDRIDNNGNYEPGNLRWATIHEQSSNKRSNNKNIGVSYVKKTNKWVAYLVKDNSYKLNSTFDTEQEAIYARKQAELNRDIVEAYDGLCDMVRTAYGVSKTFGDHRLEQLTEIMKSSHYIVECFEECREEIKRSNRTKSKDTREDGKILKGENYKAPDLKPIIKKHHLHCKI